MVYRNQPHTWLDRFFLGSRSAKGARNRLRILQEEICECVRQRSKICNPVRIVSYGSGPGHEVLGCIKEFQGNVVVESTCMDRDLGALEYGKSLASEMSLSDAITYVHGNVLHLKSTDIKYDIGVLSGLLDYFDFKTAVSVLTSVREQLSPGGSVLIANMRQHRLASTMSVLGNWNLVYREPEDIERILAMSGYEDIAVRTEPQAVFCIGMARTPMLPS